MKIARTWSDDSVQILFTRFAIDIEYLPQYTLIYGAYSYVAATLTRLLYRVIQIRFGKEMFKEYEGEYKVIKLRYKLTKLVRNIEYLGGLQIIFIFFASLFHSLEILVLAYFLINDTMWPRIQSGLLSLWDILTNIFSC